MLITPLGLQLFRSSFSVYYPVFQLKIFFKNFFRVSKGIISMQSCGVYGQLSRIVVEFPIVTLKFCKGSRLKIGRSALSAALAVHPQ